MRITKLTLIALEDRCVPAADWPMTGGFKAEQLLQTWAQYQEIVGRNTDTNTSVPM